MNAGMFFEDSNLVLNTFFEISPSLFCITTKEGDFLKLNPAWQDVLGYPVEELLHMNFTALVHPDDLNDSVEAHEEEKAGVPVIEFENRYRCKDGSYKWLSWHGRLLEEQQLIFAVARDITDRKELELKVKKSEKLFRLLTETTDDTIMQFDLELRHLYVNPASKKYFGIEPEKFIGKTHGELGFPEEDYDYWHKRIEKVIVTGLPHKETLHNKAANTWFDWNLFPEFDDNNKVVTVLSYTRNITPVIQAQEAMKENEEKYRIMFTGNPLPSWITDEATGRILEVNPSAAEQYGYTPEEFAALTVEDIRMPDENTEFQDAVIQVNSAHPNQTLCRHRKKTGKFLLYRLLHNFLITRDSRQCM